MKVANLVTAMQAKDVFANDRGNKIHTMFLPSYRYAVDFADDFHSEGWQQFDTSQDAHYFGCWVNPGKFMTLCYAEGDWSLVVCEDREHYNAEVQSMIDCYAEGFIAKAIDQDGSMTIYRQEREKFLIPA